MLYEDFKTASNTGRQVLIARSTGTCDCVDTDGILAGEADPHCQVCYGTGKIRFEILSEKIRYQELDITKSSNLEKQRFEKIKESVYVFFFPKNYKHLNMSDIIIELSHDENGQLIKPFKRTDYYKVADVKSKFVDNFHFYRVVAVKINHIGVSNGN